MSDKFDKKTRSKIMSKIKGKNTIPEIVLRKALFKEGFRYSLSHRFKEIRCKPDIVLVSRKVCIFVDGCFWHKCPICYKAPKSNKKYWIPKINKNHLRDIKQEEYLKEHGWEVIRVWEHEINNNLDEVVIKICSVLNGHGTHDRKV